MRRLRLALAPPTGRGYAASLMAILLGFFLLFRNGVYRWVLQDESCDQLETKGLSNGRDGVDWHLGTCIGGIGRENPSFAAEGDGGLWKRIVWSGILRKRAYTTKPSPLVPFGKPYSGENPIDPQSKPPLSAPERPTQTAQPNPPSPPTATSGRTTAASSTLSVFSPTSSSMKTSTSGHLSRETNTPKSNSTTSTASNSEQGRTIRVEATVTAQVITIKPESQQPSETRGVSLGNAAGERR